MVSQKNTKQPKPCLLGEASILHVELVIHLLMVVVVAGAGQWCGEELGDILDLERAG